MRLRSGQASFELEGMDRVRSNPKTRRTLLPHLGVVVAIFFLMCAATGQISPGPLSKAHQSLTGSANCTTCHKLGGGQPTFKCLECHTEIAKRLDVHKGLHATYHLTAGSSQECARCHSEHNGEDFPIVKWDPKTCDHKQTGYALEGKHAGLACNRCHSADKISAADRATMISS